MKRLTGASILSAIVLAALLAGGVMELKAEPRHTAVSGFGSSAEAPRAERGGQVVQVVDGRTLRIDGQTMRLAGIKTPVPGQQCVREGRLEPCGRSGGSGAGEDRYPERQAAGMPHDR